MPILVKSPKLRPIISSPMEEHLIEKPRLIHPVIRELHGSHVSLTPNMDLLTSEPQRAKIGYCRSKVDQVASYNPTI